MKVHFMISYGVLAVLAKDILGMFALFCFFIRGTCDISTKKIYPRFLLVLPFFLATKLLGYQQ